MFDEWAVERALGMNAAIVTLHGEFTGAPSRFVTGAAAGNFMSCRSARRASPYLGGSRHTPLRCVA